VIIFCSVWFLSKKVTKLKFKKKKNRTETGSNRPVSVRFGSVWFFWTKPVQTGLAWFFSGLAWFFSVSVWFDLVFSVLEL